MFNLLFKPFNQRRQETPWNRNTTSPLGRSVQGRILRGWALAMQGEAAAGVALLRQGLASHDVGPAVLRPHWLALLAEAYGRAGQPKAGLQVLAEAVTLMATTELW